MSFGVTLNDKLIMKANIFSIVMLCASLLFGCKPTIEDGLSYDQYISKAELAISETKVDEAILYYKKALELKPSDANTHYVLGEIYKREYQRSYEEAKRKQTSQILMHPEPNRKFYKDDPKELESYGLKIGYDEKAIQEFREAIKYDSNNWQARYLFATDQFNKKHFRKAIEELKKVIQLKPEYGNSYGVIGAAYMEIGSLDLAVENLKTAIRLDPGFAEYEYYQLGLVYRRMNKGEKVNEILKMLKDAKSMWYDELRLSLFRG